jgi:hypothetical protein
VSQARPRDDGGWLVELEGASSRSFDALVVATGIFCHPQMPDLPGEFAGEIVHVRDYRTPDAFAGRRVLVLGAGQSALDIAAEISFLAERTLIACREGHHLLPPRAFGLAFDHLDLASLNRLPWPVVRSGFQALLRLSGATPARGELPVPNHPILEHRWPALATPNIERALAERTFAVRPAPASIEGEHVTFADGRGEAFDTIVCATGYRVDFPFLPERLGRGEGIQFPLYRRTLSPHDDTLAFIGVHDAGAGRMELVERQVQWLAAVLSGRIALPSHAERWAAINACGEPRTRRRFGSSGAHTFLCDRYAYLRTLERDLRAAT